MPEYFDPSPRASKRRKVSTYGSTRSTRSDKDDPVSSILGNVSGSITGLSRRLFVGNISSTQPNDSAYVSQEDTAALFQAQEDQEELLEIAESEEEPVVKTALVRSKRGTSQKQFQNDRTSASINNGVEVVKRNHNNDGSLHKKAANDLQRQQADGFSRSASKTFSERNVDVPAISADDHTMDHALTENAEDISVTVQPRSSGRERKRTRRYSVEAAEIQETPKSTTKSTSKTKAFKQKSSGTRKRRESGMLGIPTPSKKNEKKARKSAVYDESGKQMEKDLGFKDISGPTKRLQGAGSEPHLGSVSSKTPKKSNRKSLEKAAVPQPSPEVELYPEEDQLFDSLPMPVVVVEDIPLQEDHIDHEQDTIELQRIKAIILARLTHRASHTEQPPLSSHLKGAYDTLHTLLQATVSSGESNSLLLLGSRGAGKSLLVDTALGSLQRDLSADFHTVRLNGFVQTDDRLALREIWKQLGREMEVDEDETNQVVGSYADTMTSLLGLLSQPEEVPDIGAVEYVAEKVVTKSVVFVLDEFDLFTTHPRQTLLYNLFDIAQSRKAPIAVIGCSARTDCVDCLEKRVKSRFSHRWVHVGQPKSLAIFEEVASNNLLVDERRLGSAKQEQEWAMLWNEYIKSTFLPSSFVQSLISRVFYTTKSLPDLFAALYLPIATATISTPPDLNTLASEPPSLLSLLLSLPHIHLALLICATRLEAIHSLTQINFNIVYAHYSDLLTKSRLAASASGATASGMRSWGRDVSLKAWEELVHWELLIRVGGKDDGMAEDGRMYRIDISIEEVRWAVEKLGTGMGEGLARWCKEI